MANLLMLLKTIMAFCARQLKRSLNELSIEYLILCSQYFLVSVSGILEHVDLDPHVISLSEHVLFSFLQLPPGAAGPKRGRGVFQAFLSDAPDIGSSLEAVGTHEMRTHGRGDTDRERVDGFPEFLHEHAHVREIRPHRNEGRWSNADIPGT